MSTERRSSLCLKGLQKKSWMRNKKKKLIEVQVTLICLKRSTHIINKKNSSWIRNKKTNGGPVTVVCGGTCGQNSAVSHAIVPRKQTMLMVKTLLYEHWTTPDLTGLILIHQFSHVVALLNDSSLLRSVSLNYTRHYYFFKLNLSWFNFIMK
jgi:hypothetical protein